MTTAILRTVRLDDIRMRVASQGEGPLVLFCHGWPESWYSWRHQMAAVAAAGYRAVAPDMRGYGGTDAPQDASRYTLLHLVGDMVSLLKALGETQAVVVGHDWGGAIAWGVAGRHPERVLTLTAVSTPHPAALAAVVERLEGHDAALAPAGAGWPRSARPPGRQNTRR